MKPFRLSLLLCVVLLGTSCAQLTAQSSTLKLYSRFTANPSRLPPMRFFKGENGFYHYGTALALRRSREELRFWEYELGYFSNPGQSEAYEKNWELSFRVQTRLLKPLINKQKFKGYFTIAPRLFFAREKINELHPIGYPSDWSYYGYDIPVLFNLDVHLNARLSLIATATVLNLARYWTRGQYYNPNWNDNRNKFAWTSAILDFFNEWRFGVGYVL